MISPNCSYCPILIQVHNIKFGAEVADICVNKRVVCVAFRERVAVFDARTLREKTNIVSCYPSPGVHSNPLALHDRWLAYSDKVACSLVCHGHYAV